MHDNDLVSEIKSVLSGFDLVESRLEALQIKGVSIVRHVRDVDYWGLPYGTVIVARGKGKGTPLTNIWSNRDRVGEDGFREYVGSDDSPVHGSSKPAIYHVGKQGSKFSVRDESGKELHVATDEISALEWLNSHARKRSESQSTRVKPEQGFREPPKGMHKATGEELRMYGAANRKLVDIFIYDDPKKHDTYGYGYDRNGKQSVFRKNDKVAEKTANKFAIVKAMEKKMSRFEAQLEKDYEKNETARAVYFMRNFGLRVGSTGQAGTGASEKSFGVTQMLVKHVTIKGNKASVKLPSKKGGMADFEIDDPTAIEILKLSIKNKKGDDKLFGTDDSKTGAYIKNAFKIDGIKNHNLRHYRATEAALEQLQEWMQDYDLPETYEDFLKEWAIPLGAFVDETILFDKNQAWKSYVDPYVLMMIARNNPEWVENFAKKYGDKGVA